MKVQMYGNISLSCVSHSSKQVNLKNDNPYQRSTDGILDLGLAFEEGATKATETVWSDVISI